MYGLLNLPITKDQEFSPPTWSKQPGVVSLLSIMNQLIGLILHAVVTSCACWSFLSSAHLQAKYSWTLLKPKEIQLDITKPFVQSLQGVQKTMRIYGFWLRLKPNVCFTQILSTCLSSSRVAVLNFQRIFWHSTENKKKLAPQEKWCLEDDISFSFLGNLRVPLPKPKVWKTILSFYKMAQLSEGHVFIFRGGVCVCVCVFFGWGVNLGVLKFKLGINF